MYIYSLIDILKIDKGDTGLADESTAVAGKYNDGMNVGILFNTLIIYTQSVV